ncbi:hypothetical protein BofuT4_uP080170.1 [Botrytis cinerea T4]|uniref:Uncharacterized protein n=1 Tax=Botryotinia fuckeliana (strain T4) TaxID=999810 RepID=G2YKS4_BOTF4|nr:hypothetical protein BofuT4_uP080170.1 [Botrytis cinerea T4]
MPNNEPPSPFKQTHAFIRTPTALEIGNETNGHQFGRPAHALGGGTGENRENPKMMIKNAWKGNNTWDICCLQSRGQRNSPY